MIITEEEKNKMLHALGWTKKKPGGWRNYFVTGTGSDDFSICNELVGKGLMSIRKSNFNQIQDDFLFRVTRYGKNLLRVCGYRMEREGDKK